MRMQVPVFRFEALGNSAGKPPNKFFSTRYCLLGNYREELPVGLHTSKFSSSHMRYTLSSMYEHYGPCLLLLASSARACGAERLSRSDSPGHGFVGSGEVVACV